jgi:hypothetical protein
MKLKALKIKDGSVTVRWHQEAAEGVESVWTCVDACKPMDSLAPALVALVPHAARMIGQDPANADKCSFAGITLTEKTTRDGDAYTLCRIELLTPSPLTDKPAAGKTDRFDVESVTPEYQNAIEDVVREGLRYVAAAKAAGCAVGDQ